MQAAITPTASAAPSVRASARARRAAPTSTSASPTATEDTVTEADRRDGSRFLVPPKREPVGVPPHHDDVVAGPQEEQIGRGPSEDDVAVAVERTVAQGERAAEAECGHDAAVGQPREECALLRRAGALGDDGRCQHRREERARRDLSTDLVEDDDQFVEPGSRATVLLGQVDAEPAQLRHVLPEGRAGLGVGLQQGPVRRQRVVVGQHAAHGGPERPVLVGDGDRHGCPLVPRRRSGGPRRPAARHYRTAARDRTSGRYTERREVELDASGGRTIGATRAPPPSPRHLSRSSPCPLRPSAPPDATLVARHVHYERGGHTVLDDVSLSVGPATCLGVVGPNGVGKSTLLQILAGLLVPTAGEVRVDPPSATVGYLSQEHARTGDETVRAALTRRAGVAAVEAELAAAASALAAGGPGADDRYAAALERYEAASAGDFEARLVGACRQVALPADVAEQPVSTLSGGQEARVALAAILLARFDLTLLDEPTNDLDFDGLSRLEDIVARRAGGMVIVSHDRAFLERTVTDVLELDEHSRTGEHLRRRLGGVPARARRRSGARRHRLCRLRVAARRAAQAGPARTPVGHHRRRPGEEASARQRQVRAEVPHRTHRDPGRTSPAHRTRRSTRWRRSRSRGRDGTCASPSTRRLDPATSSCAWRRRWSSGATSGSDPSPWTSPGPSGWRSSGPTGRARRRSSRRSSAASRSPPGRGASVRASWWASSPRTGACSATVPTWPTRSRRRRASPRPGPVAAGQVRAGRRGGAPTPVVALAGERTRAELAAFAALGVNFLVLDEPTNHLDLPAIEQLESALQDYGGTLLLVSHDRRLLETVATTRPLELPGRDEPSWALRVD